MHRHCHFPKRLTGVAALVCAAALTPAAAFAATALPSAPTATASTPRCATSGLVVWMNTQGSGAAGSIFYTLQFTNLSGHTCTLTGHPGVSAVSLTGAQVGSPAAWGPPATTTVTLANDATAYAALDYNNVITTSTGQAQCHAVMAAGLRVYPPDQIASKVIPFPLKACTTSAIFMGVGPVQRTAPPGQGS